MNKEKENEILLAKKYEKMVFDDLKNYNQDDPKFQSYSTKIIKEAESLSNTIRLIGGFQIKKKVTNKKIKKEKVLSYKFQNLTNAIKSELLVKKILSNTKNILTNQFLVNYSEIKKINKQQDQNNKGSKEVENILKDSNHLKNQKIKLLQAEELESKHNSDRITSYLKNQILDIINNDNDFKIDSNAKNNIAYYQRDTKKINSKTTRRNSFLNSNQSLIKSPTGSFVANSKFEKSVKENNRSGNLCRIMNIIRS